MMLRLNEVPRKPFHGEMNHPCAGVAGSSVAGDRPFDITTPGDRSKMSLWMNDGTMRGKVSHATLSV
jgi:hypothetical protein